MRIVFIGCVELSKSALELLLSGSVPEAEVVGIATLSQSAFNADFANLKPLADAHGIPCLMTDLAGLDLVEWSRSRKPDVIYCFGWSKLLGKELLAVARHGIIGFHPAALPQNRGRHPLIWALALGLAETASSFFFMDEGADSGDLLSQKPIAISEDDDAASLYLKVTRTALEQIREFTPALATGSFARVKQDESRASSWRKRTKADGQIDWRMSARSIHNLVRALSKPYPGAHCVWRGQDHKIWRTRPIFGGGAKNLEPGKVLASDPARRAFTVQTGDGTIEVLQHEFHAMPGKDEYL